RIRARRCRSGGRDLIHAMRSYSFLIKATKQTFRLKFLPRASSVLIRPSGNRRGFFKVLKHRRRFGRPLEAASVPGVRRSLFAAEGADDAVHDDHENTEGDT